MAIYGVYESVNQKSTRGAERIFDCISATDIENGTMGYLNGLATNESVVYNFATGLSAGKEIVVVDQPAWTEDESLISKQRKDQFIIPAGTKFRVRVIAKDDEFAVNTACVTTATVAALLVGAYVTIDATTGELVASATAATTPVFEGTVMRKRVQGATLVTTANTYGYSRDMYEIKVTTLA
jgi:hypothetical protein